MTSAYTVARLKAILRESTLPPVEIFDEYVEIMLQLAWVSSFSIIFPLGPIISLVNNAIELRSDMLKMTRVQGRPMPRTATSIGPWQGIQHNVIRVGVFVNLGLYSVTLQNFDWMLGTDRLSQVLGAVVCAGLLLLAMGYLRAFIAPVSHTTKRKLRQRRKRSKQRFVNALRRQGGGLSPSLQEAMKEFHIV